MAVDANPITDTDKPVFVFCHGAWHPSYLYDPLKKAIEERGYEMLIPELPTMGVGTPGLNWADDAATVLETAKPIFDQGRRVISVGHSYGGVPACAAIKDNTVSERAARGEKGGFSGLVFLCAFAINKRGQSAMDNTNPDGLGAEIAFHKLIELPDDGGKMLFVTEVAKEVLYNDFTSAEMKQEYFDAIVPQALDCFVTPVDFVPSDVRTIPKTFIVCDNDLAIPPRLQLRFVETSGSKKVHLSGGHSAFASMPGQVADVLVGVAEGRV